MRHLPVAALLMVGSAMAALPKSATVQAPVPTQTVNVGEVKVVGSLSDPKAVSVETIATDASSRLVLDRSFAEAIQGNIDRETAEWRNQESR